MVRSGKRETVGVREAAELLGCHPNSVYRRLWAGELPAQRLIGGGHYRIAVADLDGLLIDTAQPAADLLGGRADSGREG